MEIHANFGWGVGVGAESERNAHAGGHVENCLAGVKFLAVFAEASSVDFDSDVVLNAGFQELAEESAAIFFGIKTEFLGQVRVANDLE